MVLENRVFDISFIFDWGGIRTGFHSMLGSGDSNFASNYASRENNIKSELEKTLEMMK